MTIQKENESCYAWCKYKLFSFLPEKMRSLTMLQDSDKECVNVDTMQREILGGNYFPIIFLREREVYCLLIHELIYLKLDLLVPKFPCGTLICQIMLALMREFKKHSSIKIQRYVSLISAKCLQRWREERKKALERKNDQIILCASLNIS